MNNKDEHARSRPVAMQYRLIWGFVFLFYLAALVYLIFYFTERGEGGVNLEPLKEIKRFYGAIKEGVLTVTAYQNLLGNVILFIPFGVLLPLISNRRFTLPKTILAGFSTILAIESIQYLTKSGIFDVDDFILNGLGVMLGWLAYKLLALIYRRHFRGSDYYQANQQAVTAVPGRHTNDGRAADWWSAINSDYRFFGKPAPKPQSQPQSPPPSHPSYSPQPSHPSYSPQPPRQPETEAPSNPFGETMSVDWRTESTKNPRASAPSHDAFRRPANPPSDENGAP